MTGSLRGPCHDPTPVPLDPRRLGAQRRLRRRALPLRLSGHHHGREPAQLRPVLGRRARRGRRCRRADHERRPRQRPDHGEQGRRSRDHRSAAADRQHPAGDLQRARLEGEQPDAQRPLAERLSSGAWDVEPCVDDAERASVRRIGRSAVAAAGQRARAGRAGAGARAAGVQQSADGPELSGHRLRAFARAACRPTRRCR